MMRAPMSSRQYSAERIRRRPRFFMLTSTEFYGNWRAKVPNNSSKRAIRPTAGPAR
jgi:hypothetical protein